MALRHSSIRVKAKNRVWCQNLGCFTVNRHSGLGLKLGHSTTREAKKVLGYIHIRVRNRAKNRVLCQNVLEGYSNGISMDALLRILVL